MIRSKAIVAFGLTGGLMSFASTVAYAAADAEKKAGLPQFDPSTISEQIVWLVILFALFYILMSKVALPRLTEVLEARQSRIDTDLEQAQKLKQDAEKALQEFEKLMTDARAKAHDIQSDARQAISAHATERQTAVEADLAKEAADAEARIQASVDAAMAEIKTVAADAAAAISGKVSGVDVNSDAASVAVEAVLKEVR